MPAKEINFYNISPYLRYIHVDDCIHGGYLIPWRQIYDYELVFVLSGNLHVKTERDEYTLTSGDVHIMPPFLRHTRYSDAPIYLYSLHFDLSYMGESNDFSCLEVYSAPIQKYLQQHTEIAVDERFIHRPYYSLSNVELPQKLEVSDTSVYVKILNQMLDVFDKKPFGFELDLKICILQLLRHIISDMHSKSIHHRFSRYDKGIVKCIDYFNNHFTERIDIDEFAMQNGFTPNYFRRLFKKMTGMPPNEYIIDLRIKQAINYMRTGIYTISEIASMVGYNNLHYFSRLFRKKKGFAPSQFLTKYIYRDIK